MQAGAQCALAEKKPALWTRAGFISFEGRTYRMSATIALRKNSGENPIAGAELRQRISVVKLRERTCDVKTAPSMDSAA